MSSKNSCNFLYAGSKLRYTVLVSALQVLVLFMLVSGCTCNRSPKQREAEITIDISDEAFEGLLNVKKIFYALPSPVETAMLLKSSGAVYNEELLNPADNSSRYLTNKSMAVNLGIYTADLSYASLFNQTQTSMQYMNVAKGLADNLGIIDAIDSYTLERLEENLGDHEAIIDIVSETFMNSSSFLQENNREPVAALMFAGGWIEGLYLAVNLVDEDNLETDPIAKRIVDNKLSLEIMMLLLDENSHNNDVAQLIGEIEKIETIYNKIEIRSTPVEVIRAPGEGANILKSNTVSNMDRDVFHQLKSAVLEIRQSFIS